MIPNVQQVGKGTKKRYGKVHRIVDIVALLLLVFYLVFRSSTVQTYLVKNLTAYLSHELKAEISVSGVDLSWYFDLILDDVKIKDPKHRPVLFVRHLVLDVDHIGFRRHKIDFKNVRLVGADIRMVRYAKDSVWNYTFLTDYFSSGKPDTTRTKRPWAVTVKSVNLLGCRFQLQDQTTDTIADGMCYSNLRIRDISLSVEGLKTVKDTVYGKIKHLTAKEQCGLDLKAFSADVKFSSVGLVAKQLHFTTNSSDVRMDLKFDYRRLRAFDDFLDSVTIHSTIRPSELNLQDIRFFASDLKGMDDLIKFEGEVNGPVNNLRARDFKFEYGQNTRYEGNINLTGLANIEETFVHLSIKQLKTSIADLRRINLPAGEKIKIADTYNKLGTIGVKGFFTGFYNDFVSYATFKTEAGDFSTDLSVKKGKAPVFISYNGKLQGRNVDLGKLIPKQDYLGRLNMNLQVAGKGIDLANLDAHLEGTLDSLEFKGNKIDNISLSGAVKQKAFTGLAKIRGALIHLDFNGKVDMNKKLPVFDFTASLRDAKMTKLNLIARDTSATLSTHMNLNFEGNNFDNLLGKLQFDSTLYLEKGKRVPMDRLVLQTKALSLGDKQVLLRSDYVDGDVTGLYSFTRFYSSLNLILNKYLPSLRLWNAVDPTDQFPQNFFYHLAIKDPSKVTAVFAPGMSIADGTEIKGSFSAPDRSLIINGDSKLFVYNGLHYHDFSLSGHTSNNQLFLTSDASRIDLKEHKDSTSTGIDSVHFQATVAGDSIRYRARWNDKGVIDHNRGDIAGYAAFRSLSRIDLGIKRGQLMLNDSIWTINPNNAISVDSTTISIDNLAFSGQHERLLLQGIISNDPDQKLNIYFQQVDISGLDKFIDVYGVDIDGVADGTVSLRNLYHSPNLTSNLNILGLHYNKVLLGDAAIRSSWNDDEKALLADLHIIDASGPVPTEPISASGSFHPLWEDNNFNFDITLKDLQLHAINPFLDTFMSGLNGMVSGNLQLLGSSQFPYLKGVVNAHKASFKIDYLNTRYTFDDKVTFDQDALHFDNFTVKDTLGNTGVVNGLIKNHSFNNWALDLNMKAKSLLGFNKEHSFSEMYYGKAIGTGDISISGPVKNLNFTLKARTDKGTNIFIPLNNPGTASENDFITFVNHLDTLGTQKDGATATASGLSMNMDFDVTDAANIQLFLPYEMGTIEGSGNGLINMGLTREGDYSIKGDYKITKGKFHFTLPKYTLNRSFDILDGGYIRWSGSPYDATINMKAAYKTKVSLSSLPSNTTQLSQRIDVNCIISLKDNLFSPKIKFSIDLPGADESTKRLVYSAIDTTNEAEMNQQMISLLVVGSFSLYNEQKSLASSLGAQPYELISSQLNNMLSQISTDFDIGFNYRPGDALTSDEVELMLSKQLFNDRLRVEVNGNYGVTNNNANNLQRSSTLVGDVNIEYKLTPDGHIMLKAYNKVNRDIIDIYAPYKQGLGISYRKEFDFFRDLFHKKKKVIKPMDK